MADDPVQVRLWAPKGAVRSEPTPAPPLPPEALTEIVSGLAHVPRTVPAGADQSGQPRSLRLIATEAYDVWLITWPPGGAIDDHDHGDAWSVMRVVVGELVHVVAAGETRVGRGVSVVTPAGQVHRLRNPLGDETTTVHGYSPPLAEVSYHLDPPTRALHPAGSASRRRTRSITSVRAEATSVRRVPALGRLVSPLPPTAQR